MPACHHITNETANTGAVTACASCQAPIIHTGTKWVWYYDLDPHKRRKLCITWEVDRLTGKHVVTVP